MISEHRSINDCLSQLGLKGALGLREFKRRLRANAKNQARLFDLFFECRAALIFLRNGWQVTLRESPDLELRLNGEVLYAEVKHFYEKEQDRLDELAMQAAAGEFVRIGDLSGTEGTEPWKQLAQVALRKADQYMEGAPNILVVESESDSMGLMVPSAVHEYDDAASKMADDIRLNRLNGIMLVNVHLICLRPEPHNVEFCLTSRPAVPMSGGLIRALDDIRLETIEPVRDIHQDRFQTLP